MAYDALANINTGDLVTASWLNQIGTNFAAHNDGGFAVLFDGGGAAITTGTTIDIPIFYKCNISDAWLYVSGGYASDCRICVHPWYRSASSDYPTAASDAICTSDNAIIASTATGRFASNGRTSWTVALAAGSVLTLNIDDCDLITKAVVAFALQRSS